MRTARRAASTAEPDADETAPVTLDLEPGDAALIAGALEQLIEANPGSELAERAMVIAAYLRLQRHKATRGTGPSGPRDPRTS